VAEHARRCIYKVIVELCKKRTRLYSVAKLFYVLLWTSVVKLMGTLNEEYLQQLEGLMQIEKTNRTSVPRLMELDSTNV